MIYFLATFLMGFLVGAGIVSLKYYITIKKIVKDREDLTEKIAYLKILNDFIKEYEKEREREAYADTKRN